MTLVQMQPRSTSSNAVQTAADPMDAAGPQVWDAMTVEVALSVMAAARTTHLLVCDEDAQCTGIVTQARLTAVRDSRAYTDQVRLRDIVGNRVPFATPLTTIADAEHTMRHRRLAALPMVDDHGNALGVLALSR
ncbi:CBS domain-containing protein [Streptomyces sp. 1222.5]|uniref:CBS domain-containing protein n=1 Tax=unclassified Streptomyces TaxID=2593676 RepID=UPI000895079A|nr:MULTISPECIES: CBS domain-containing protein [unclassified Streptomyces]PKW12453.1 CBS domain protein [Streptomyces sp. 5112.2]SEB56163.1 CBS domain-containing protein [Streptomyces sp. 1222.5]